MAKRTRRVGIIGVAMAQIILLLSWLWLPAGTAYAQSGLEPEEQTLVFHNTVNKTLRRTFTLRTDEPIQNLEIDCDDPVDATTDAAIECTSMIFDPSFPMDEMDGLQQFTITINTGENPGFYVGSLTFYYDGQPDDESVVVNLEITVDPIPSVEPTVESKNLTLAVAHEWFGWLQSDDAEPPESTEGTISLVQKGEGDATIAAGGLSAFSDNDNQTLPEDAVRLSTQFPMTIESGITAPVEVVAGGRGLRAGIYNGSALFRVENQPTVIEVPIQVKVKDGPLLALILLLIGPVLGVLIDWWNNEGQARHKLMKEIDQLEERINEEKLLPVETQERAKELLKQAQDAHLAGKDTEEIKKTLKTAHDLLDAASAAARAFLVEKLDPLVEELEGLKYGHAYREQLKDDLQAIREWIEKSEYPNLKDAESKLNEVAEEVERLKAVIAEVDKLMPTLSDEAKEKLETKVNQATSIEQMDQAVEVAKAPPTKGVDETVFGAMAAHERKGIDLPSARLAWKREQRRLRWGSFAVTALVYLFTVVVGLVILYGTNPTFGASSEDYISVFLWGLSANLLGMQTINLKSLYTKAKETG